MKHIGMRNALSLLREEVTRCQRTNWSDLFFLRTEQIGSKKAVGGCGRESARDRERCRTGEVSKQKVSFLVMERCTETRAY